MCQSNTQLILAVASGTEGLELHAAATFPTKRTIYIRKGLAWWGLQCTPMRYCDGFCFSASLKLLFVNYEINSNKMVNQNCIKCLRVFSSSFQIYSCVNMKCRCTIKLNEELNWICQKPLGNFSLVVHSRKWQFPNLGSSWFLLWSRRKIPKHIFFPLSLQFWTGSNAGNVDERNKFKYWSHHASIDTMLVLVSIFGSICTHLQELVSIG